jgi:hypothetical protein
LKGLNLVEKIPLQIGMFFRKNEETYRNREKIKGKEIGNF